jgi:hypothetical protein
MKTMTTSERKRIRTLMKADMDDVERHKELVRVILGDRKQKQDRTAVIVKDVTA